MPYWNSLTPTATPRLQPPATQPTATPRPQNTRPSIYSTATTAPATVTPTPSTTATVTPGPSPTPTNAPPTLFYQVIDNPDLSQAVENSAYGWNAAPGWRWHEDNGTMTSCPNSEDGSCFFWDGWIGATQSFTVPETGRYMLKVKVSLLDPPTNSDFFIDVFVSNPTVSGLARYRIVNGYPEPKTFYGCYDLILGDNEDVNISAVGSDGSSYFVDYVGLFKVNNNAVCPTPHTNSTPTPTPVGTAQPTSTPTSTPTPTPVPNECINPPYETIQTGETGWGGLEWIEGDCYTLIPQTTMDFSYISAYIEIDPLEIDGFFVCTNYVRVLPIKLFGYTIELTFIFALSAFGFIYSLLYRST